LELGDSGRLRFEFQMSAWTPPTPESRYVSFHAAYSTRVPEHREQIARCLGRGADCADPCGYVVFAGELLTRLYLRHFRLLPAEHLGQAGTAEARRDPDRLQGLREPPALALANRCRHSASVGS